MGRLMKKIKCPNCRKPLVKGSSKGRYDCETENCPIIFIKFPYNSAIRQIFYKPSANRKLVEKIEKAPVEFI
jgi:ribosomal protein L37AE/L43A